MSDNYKKILRILVVVLLDMLLMVACGGLALVLRFDLSFNVPNEYVSQMISFLCVQIVITVGVFLMRRMYHYVWRMVSVYDVADMIISVALAFLISYLSARLIGIYIPNSVAAIMLILDLVTMVGMRCALRFYESWMRAIIRMRGAERIMLIGAGEAGRILLHEISFSRRTEGKVCCIIDDNHSKWGKRMDGVLICGGRDAIPELVKKKKITRIIFAIPSASPGAKHDILQMCRETGCKLLTLPGVYQLINGEVSLKDVKEVQVEDLLGRDPVVLEEDELQGFIGGKVVLVTGGGGSIGSELCRQIAQYRPKTLVILDIYENNAYDLQQELASACKWLDLRIEIASVRDREKMFFLFGKYRPDIVFHAAAHKHVPLMERCPEEAVKNNIFGTYNVVCAAEEFRVKRFVMISTDKAVNPTNFMGATKRFCEMILQSRGESETEFCAVRFGNVLGSNGSVIPLFKRQIAAGGPITLTDKRIIRYFMTIAEASQLVLEAGAMANPGQIFVLDMGEPVKILTLAENLIRLSGLEPYKDIEIQEIGLRPGEKLYEELLIKQDTLGKTPNDKIFTEQRENVDPAFIAKCLEELKTAVDAGVSPEELMSIMKAMVTTYAAPDEINGK